MNTLDITNSQAILLLPAYNEGSRIGQPGEQPGDTFKRAIDHYQTGLDSDFGSAAEVVVINDGSTDNTKEVATNMGVRVLEHADGLNHGRGAALTNGFSALSSQTEAIGYTDADGSYDYETQRQLMAEIFEGSDAAVAFRASGEGQHANFLRKIAHTALNRTCSLVAPTGIKDPQAGAKWFNGDVAADLWQDAPEGWAADRYAMNRALRHGLIVREVGALIVSAEGSSVDDVKDALIMMRDSLVINLQNAKNPSAIRQSATNTAISSFDRAVDIVKRR